jgi:hypothetical protein
LIDGAAKQIEKFTAIKAGGSANRSSTSSLPCLLLSDVSQSSNVGGVDPMAHLSAGATKEVVLSEIVRSSRRIVEGARAFQTNDDDTLSKCCHSADGPPLKVFQFSRKLFEFGLLQRYSRVSLLTLRAEELLESIDCFSDMGFSPRIQLHVDKTVEALTHLEEQFPSLDFNGRVAVVVPNSAFLRVFKPALQSKLQEKGQEGAEKGAASMAFEFLDAAQSSRLISNMPGKKQSSKQRLVLDTVENFNGLERLIVIAVGLDSPIEHGAMVHGVASRTRSNLYRAITRAQMMVVVVNEVVVGGWLEFLTRVKFNKDVLFDGDSEKPTAWNEKGKARDILDEEAEEAKSPWVAVAAQIRAAGIAPEAAVLLAVLAGLAGLAVLAGQAGLAGLAGLAVLAVLAVLVGLEGLAGQSGLVGLAVLAVLVGLAVPPQCETFRVE